MHSQPRADRSRRVRDVLRTLGLAARPADRHAPHLEPLEERRVLAAVAWDGGGDGTSWHDAVNWSTDAVPTASDDVTIDIAGTPTISFTSTTGTRSVNSLVCRETINFTGGRLNLLTTASMEAPTTLNGGTLGGGAWTMVGQSLQFTSNGNNSLAGPITVNGNLDRTGSSGYLSINGGLTLNGVLSLRGNDTVDFSGTQTFAGGTIDFVADNSAGHSVRVAGPDGSVLTIAADAQVTGGSTSLTSSISSTGTGTQALLNLGTINADNASAGIQITTDSFTNQGTALASSSGTLQITAASWDSAAGSLGADNGTLNIGGSVTTDGLGLPSFFRNAGAVNVIGTINNAGDTMTLNAQTGTFTLNGGTISGGTLTMTGGAQLLFTSNGNNSLAGPITVNGNLDRTGSSGYLNISGGLTLSGVLSLRGNDTVDFFGTQTFAGGTIDFIADNSAGHSVRVAGPDGSTLTLAADAQVTGGSASLTSNISSTGSGTQALLNLGTINADNASAGIQITTDSFTNQGTIGAQGGGTLRVDLPNSGTTWTNEGTIALNPGGKVEIIDNLVLAATSNVQLFAQGAGTTNYGILSATGTIAIDGAFTGAYINGYVPAEGTFFDFLTATGGRTGEFTSTNLPTPPAGDKTVLIYEGTRVRMLSTDLADLDLNGSTNTQDFILYLNLWASHNPAADINGDGLVDTRDFIAFLNLWADG